MEGVNLMMNIIVLSFGILFLLLVLFVVFNVVVRKKKYDHLYTPFDDAMNGTKRDSEEKY